MVTSISEILSSTPASIVSLLAAMENDSNELQRLIEHREVALGELFSAYHATLERIVKFRIDPRVQSRVDSADVLQETYLRVANRLDEYLQQPSVSFFIWLRQQTLQTLIDLHRVHFREKRSADKEVRTLGVREFDATSISIARFLLADMTSPSNAVVRMEEKERLEIALNSMEEIDREVLALRHFEHLTNSQVAEVLHLSPTAASNRYIRAVARLSEILSCGNIPPNQDTR